MRFTAALAALAACLLAAATADAKTEVIFTPSIGSLEVGKAAVLRLEMHKLVGERTGRPREVAAKGATPTITLTYLSTGRSLTYRGTRADARGRSTARLMITRPGVWQTRVRIDRHAVFEMEPIDYEPTAEPTTAGSAASGGGSPRGGSPAAGSGGAGASSSGGAGGGGPGLAVAAGGTAILLLLLAVAAVAAARRRRPHPGTG